MDSTNTASGLFDLNYDDLLIAAKKRESDVLRGEASNAVDSAPAAVARFTALTDEI